MNGCYLRNDTGKCLLREREPHNGCAKRLKNDMCGLPISHTYKPVPASGRPGPDQENEKAQAEQTDRNAPPSDP